LADRLRKLSLAILRLFAQETHCFFGVVFFFIVILYAFLRLFGTQNASKPEKVQIRETVFHLK